MPYNKEMLKKNFRDCDLASILIANHFIIDTL